MNGLCSICHFAEQKGIKEKNAIIPSVSSVLCAEYASIHLLVHMVCYTVTHKFWKGLYVWYKFVG